MIESDMQVVLAMLLYFVVVVVIGFVYAKRSETQHCAKRFTKTPF